VLVCWLLVRFVAPLLSEVQAMSGGNSGWHSRYTDDGGGDVLWQDPALVWAEFYSQHMVPPSLAYHALEGILDTDKKGPIIPTPPTPPSPNITRFYCPAPLVSPRKMQPRNTAVPSTLWVYALVPVQQSISPRMTGM
jgi:hypothetical protein